MKKIDVVFNCSTNVVGGGIQNSVNFIVQVIKNDGFGLQWFFLLSPQVYAQLKNILPENSFYIAKRSPASSFSARRQLKKLITSLEPKFIYTSAGPAYIKFDVPHMMGCSNPYILGASTYAYRLYGNIIQQFKRRLKSIYQRMNIKKANVWVAQTEASQKQLLNIVGKKAPVHIIYNSVAKEFLEFLTQAEPSSNKILTSGTTSYSILVPTAYYKHKDLERIPEVAALLKKKFHANFKFIFTIESEVDYNKIINLAKGYEVENCMENIGAFEHSKALEIYLRYDVVLQPSVLEVFSTTYIEAISTLKPLVVPNFEFARSICGNYANYYDCNNIYSYVDALCNALQDTNLEIRYNKAVQIARKYGSQEQRSYKIVALIKEYLVKNEGKHV
ncbi:glycosyltransferase family 1 protein [Cronobacter dublinensis subsp. dublinensis]|nr:glycosyltransferase family 1 protein [Cronobacter dublinensis subsp. dublinensis]EGT5670981.1 glycosyltransferase family 1 protein [Cronobacter dublinensis subsp. dublinensis]EGT5675116.1 glycosyltransferase family 1 protein [Cronobacter dublinensis subsp. dublinensis]EGT5679194.1 glycosyltransferase family 1 protein [Cronobacter dublinensis subsp. dublinensis]EGT5687805.1 glycosyltransferase family 1 protein [Cronobacter dublinensis subsp. dublinensis]